MPKELRSIDISDQPELLRLVEEIQENHEPRLLKRDGEDLAILTPVKRSRRKRAGRPVTSDDPLWNIIGMGRSGGIGDVSENKHKYLAQAYTPDQA